MKYSRSVKTHLMLLGVLFVAVIIIGRIIVTKKDQTIVAPAQNLTAASSTTSSQTTSAPAAKSELGLADSSDSDDDSVASCVEKTTADIKSTKTSYEKGSILVGFVADTSYVDAKNTLAIYGLVPQNDAQAEASYSNQRLITAAVKPGEEIQQVCVLKRDAHVRYTHVNTLFTLHD